MQWEYDSLNQKLIEIYIEKRFNQYDTTTVNFYPLDDSKNVLEEFQIKFKKKEVFDIDNYGERTFKAYEFSVDTNIIVFGYDNKQRLAYTKKADADEKTITVSYEFDEKNKIEKRKIVHHAGFYKGREYEFIFDYNEEGNGLKTHSDSTRQGDSTKYYTTYEYNSKGLLSKLMAYKNDEVSEINRFEYIYDERGNAIEKKRFYQKEDGLEELKSEQQWTIIYWD